MTYKAAIMLIDKEGSVLKQGFVNLPNLDFGIIIFDGRSFQYNGMSRGVYQFVESFPPLTLTGKDFES